MSDSSFTISGTMQVGDVLSASPSFTYQWYRSSVAIVGATSSTYTLVVADIGNTITAVRIDSSAATSVVVAAGGVPVNTVLPTVSGTPQVGQTLTATNGTWTNSPTSYAYQWNLSGSPISGATAATYVLIEADVGGPLTVSVVATNSGGSSTPATSAPTAAVIDIVPTNSAVPTISGTAQVGNTLTATTGTWTHNPTSFASQWANTSIGFIPGATGLTYVPTAADMGFVIVVFTDATNSGGTSAPAESAGTHTVLPAIPVNSALPTISGTAQIGQTLSASTGGWANSPSSFAYQWSDSATGRIGGATASTYVPTSANLGHTLTVSVVATNSGGSSSPATSAATASVTVVLQTLSLSANTFTVGNAHGTLIGNVQNTTTGSTVTFSSLSVANALQLALVSGVWQIQVGSAAPGSPGTSTFNLIETLAGGANSPHTTSGLSVSEVAAIPVNTALPAISGTAQVGQTLTASQGTWTNTPTSYTYQWNSSAVGAISGATAATYVPVTGDIGNMLTVSVVATNARGSGAPATSAATSAVTAAGTVPVNTVLPTISGTPQVGQTLTATNGTWTHSPTSYAYQWNLSGSPISGATAATYVLIEADVGDTLTVSVVATNSGGSSSPATSVPTAAVIDMIPVFVALPVVSGTPHVGQTLMGTNGTWTNNPTSYSYQWGNTIQGGIPGATASTYVPVSADIGHMINISVVATNSGGSAPSVTSSAVGPIIAAGSVPVNTVLPTLSGTAQVGQTLTANPGTWTNNPTSFTYQWNRAGTPIGGATASTYVPVSADVGNTLTISVTATNGSGSSTPATSAATSAVIDIIPTNSAVPTISGTAQVGQTLTASNGTWTHTPTSYAYQWNSSAGGPISGATASTYVPVTGNIGNTLTVSVIATNSGGSSSPATSAATASVTGASGNSTIILIAA
jgi:hypothetical protein